MSISKECPFSDEKCDGSQQCGECKILQERQKQLDDHRPSDERVEELLKK